MELRRADFSLDAKYIAYFSLNRFSDSLFYGSLAFDATTRIAHNHASTSNDDTFGVLAFSRQSAGSWRVSTPGGQFGTLASASASCEPMKPAAPVTT